MNKHNVWYISPLDVLIDRSYDKYENMRKVNHIYRVNGWCSDLNMRPTIYSQLLLTIKSQSEDQKK